MCVCQPPGRIRRHFQLCHPAARYSKNGGQAIQLSTFFLWECKVWTELNNWMNFILPSSRGRHRYPNLSQPKKTSTFDWSLPMVKVGREGTSQSLMMAMIRVLMMDFAIRISAMFDRWLKLTLTKWMGGADTHYMWPFIYQKILSRKSPQIRRNMLVIRPE